MRRRGVVLVAAPVLLPGIAIGLVLEAGQRIAPRSGSIPHSSYPQGKASLFDLPLVEQWATERELNERHLKTVYQILMKQTYDKDFDLLSSLQSASFPKRHAADLVATFTPCTSMLTELRPSSSGGMKLVLKLTSGKLVESVLIQHNPTGNSKKSRRYTVCVSSQVGCARACSFCATGTLGLLSQLTSAEILEQVWIAQSCIENRDELRNVVFMGMVRVTDILERARRVAHSPTYPVFRKPFFEHVSG